MDDIGKFWSKRRWFSICVKHGKYDKDCKLCNIGGWTNVWKWKIGSVLYKSTPRIWIWWMNK